MFVGFYTNIQRLRNIKVDKFKNYFFSLNSTFAALLVLNLEFTKKSEKGIRCNSDTVPAAVRFYKGFCLQSLPRKGGKMQK